MQNPKLSFLAQRLDNQDPDHMEQDQRPLVEEDAGERKELDRQISKVSLDGSKVFSEGYHAAFLLKNEFLLKTPSEQKDEAGRIAPIICYGRVPSEPPESWPNSVVQALTAFAGRINRTISGKSAEVARNAVEAIVKKKRRNNLRRKALWAGTFAIGLAVIGVIWWIFFREQG